MTNHQKVIAVQPYSKPRTAIYFSFLLIMQINVNVTGREAAIRRLTAAIVVRVWVFKLEMNKTVKEQINSGSYVSKSSQGPIHLDEERKCGIRLKGSKLSQV